MKQQKQTAKELTDKDYEKLGRDMWMIYESNYRNRNRAYWFTFLKGIVYGLGIFLGGTIVVAIVLYVLNMFDSLTFIDKLLNAINDPTAPIKNN
jgi:Domain of unknown function (DUF5665)